MSDKPKVREFFVDTNFQKMARRPGGVPRNLAIERAQANIDLLKPEFADWLNLELQQLSAVIEQFERNQDNAASLDEICRRCSQLRDVGTTMGFQLLTFVANNLCEIFETVKNGADYAKELIDCHVDSLQLARREPYKNASPDQVPELSSGLRRTIELVSIIPGRVIK